MKQNNLLLRRHTGKAPGHPHGDELNTLGSNLRWACDGFEIPCANGDVVRVMFAIDTCDREIIGWLADTMDITPQSVRSLMRLCIKRRFGQYRTPHALEWLSDNRLARIADETASFALSLGLLPCFAPVRRADSKGIAELFTRTFQRDHIDVHDLPDAVTVLLRFDGWLHDYNKAHPRNA